jgi:hypothetical protein
MFVCSFFFILTLIKDVLSYANVIGLAIFAICLHFGAIYYDIQFIC